MKFLTICIGLIISSAVIYAQSLEVKELLQRGDQLYQEQKYTEALTSLTEVIQKDASNTEAYLLRAYTKERLKDFTGAITDLNIYLELKPDNAEALFSRGMLYFQAERYQQAKEDFIKVIQLPKSETNTIYYQRGASGKGSHQMITAQGSMQALLLNYIGSAETRLGNYKQALQYLDSAIDLQNDVADYYVNRGLAKEGISDVTAINDYQQALKLRSDHPVALHNLAVLQRKQKGISEVDYLESAIESDSSMLAPYLERAYQRMEGGYYKGALEDYVKALSINPKDPEIWLNSGLAREKISDLKGAYSDYTKAIELNEKFEKAWLNRGNVLSKLGRHKDAIEDYTIALVHTPEYAAAFYNRALAYHKLKENLKACDDLKRAEQLGQKVDKKIKKEICE